MFSIFCTKYICFKLGSKYISYIYFHILLAYILENTSLQIMLRTHFNSLLFKVENHGDWKQEKLVGLRRGLTWIRYALWKNCLLGFKESLKNVGNEYSKVKSLREWKSMVSRAQREVSFLDRKKGISSFRPVYILSLDHWYPNLLGYLLKSRFLGLHLRSTESEGWGPRNMLKF